MNTLQKILKNKKAPKFVLVLILIIFSAFTIFLASTIKMGISSDSYYHLEVSQAYSKTLGIPENTPETYQWRDITRVPYLPHWINGRIINLNDSFFNFDEVFVLRFFNILCALGTLVFVYLTSKKLIKNKWGQLLPVFLLSNTLMFVFLSSSINYDNLTIFLASGAIYFLIKFLQRPIDPANSLLMFIFLLLGSLTKTTTLPLAFIITVVWVVILFRRKVLRKEFFKQLTNFSNILIFIIFISLVILNLRLYGVNILTYGSLTPSCLDMLTYEQCLENGVFYRNIYKIPKVFEGNILDAAKLVLQGKRTDPISYIPFWIIQMSKKIFGIMGDKSLYMKYEFLPFYFVYFFIGIYQVFKNRKRLRTEDKVLVGISVFYALVLLYYHNYKTYITHDWRDLALQGRYIFPVLAPMYIVFSRYFLKIKNKKVLKILTVLLIIIFLLGNIAYFFVNVPSEWFM